MSDSIVIRRAEVDGGDAAACAAIYAPYVTSSVATFETEPPDAGEMRRRLIRSHAWVVAEEDGGVVGYAYASAHRDRAAYNWAADVAVYIADSHHRLGLGRRLYAALFPLVRDAGMWTLCSGITIPNASSIGLHEALGFELVGVYKRIGYKDGAWRDVAWYQLDLRPGEDGAPE